MQGLQRATTLNLAQTNLSDVPVILECQAKDEGTANELCARLSSLLVNQGADVIDDLDGERTMEARNYFLRLDLRSRVIMRREQGLFLRIVTFDIFEDEPALDEYAVEIQMTLRDKDQFLLAREKLVARFRASLGWDNPAPETFSNDLYRQVTQMIYNGHLRERVFRGDPSAISNSGTADR